MENDFSPKQEVIFDEKTRLFKKIDLVITSPPYFARKEYEGDDYETYLELLKNVFRKVWTILSEGRLVCVNIGDIPNLEHLEQRKCIAEDFNPLMRKIGYSLQDEIIWKKDDPWANNPHIRYENQEGRYRILPSFEHIFIYRKGKDYRKIEDKLRASSLKTGLDKIEWKTFVSGLWDIPSVRKNKEHPAQFPRELPSRLIRMYSFPGDVVLDPFCGTGTTMQAATNLGRHGIGYDPNYKDVVQEKCFRENHKEQI